MLRAGKHGRLSNRCTLILIKSERGPSRFDQAWTWPEASVDSGLQDEAVWGRNSLLGGLPADRRLRSYRSGPSRSLDLPWIATPLQRCDFISRRGTAKSKLSSIRPRRPEWLGLMTGVGHGPSSPLRETMVGNGVEPGGSARGPRYRSLGMGCASCILLERRRLCRRHVGTFHTSSCIWQPLRQVPSERTMSSEAIKSRSRRQGERVPWNSDCKASMRSSLAAVGALAKPSRGNWLTKGSMWRSWRGTRGIWRRRRVSWLPRRTGASSPRS